MKIGSGMLGMDERGFSLIELMAVLCIMGILTAIAVPAISSRLPDYRLRSAVSGLFSNLQWVKQEAIRINGECALYFDAAKGKYHIVKGGPDGVCNGAPAGNPPVPQNDDVLLKSVILSDYGGDVNFGSGNATQTITGKKNLPATVSYYHNWVRFNSKGMARERGYVYLTNRDGSSCAVGTPSSAGAIVVKKCFGDYWE